MGFSFVSIIPLLLSGWVFTFFRVLLVQPVTDVEATATVALVLAVALAAPARGAFGNRRAPTKAQAEVAARARIRSFS